MEDLSFWIFQRDSSLSHKIYSSSIGAVLTFSSPPPQSQLVDLATAVSNLFDTLLTGGPLLALAPLAGFNVSTSQDVACEKRIPLITGRNYQDVIVREPMTPEEGQQRVWFAVMYVSLSL